MEIVITAAAAAGIAGAVAWFARGRSRDNGHELPTDRVLHEAKRSAEEIRAEAEEIRLAQAEGQENLSRLREQVELELRERRAEIVRLEERILQREESLEVRLSDLARREQSLVDREQNVERLRSELREARQEQLRELERVAGLS